MNNYHHSFKEFSHARDPKMLPFNASPDRTEGAGEASTFLALPFKRNAQPIDNNKTIYSLHKKDLPEYEHLDFQYWLNSHFIKRYQKDSIKTKIKLDFEKNAKEDAYDNFRDDQKKYDIESKQQSSADIQLTAESPVKVYTNGKCAILEEMKFENDESGLMPTSDLWYHLNQLRGNNSHY